MRWCSHLASFSKKLMVRLSNLVTLGSRPEIWTLFTIHKYIFHAFLKDPAIVFPPTITLLSEWCFWSLCSSSVGFRVLWWVFSAPDEPLQLPLLDEGFDLLLDVVALGSVMPMISVETVVLVSGPLVRIAL